MDIEQGFQLGDLRGMVQRRAGLSAAVAGGIFLLSIVIAAVLPDQYEAAATILVEPQSISSNLVAAQVGGVELGQRLQIMTMQILSRSRLSRIIDDLKLYEDESEDMTREEVIGMMREKIRVVPVVAEIGGEAEGPINTFRLSFISPSASTAAAVANRLANDYIEEHIKERVQLSGDTADFIEAELQRLTTQIREVEAQIAQVKGENPGRLPESFNSNQKLYAQTIDELRGAQMSLAMAESDETFYNQQALVGLGYNIDARFRPDEASPSRRLSLLELQIAELLSAGYTEKHPDIIAKRLEIAQVQAQFESQLAEQEEAKEEVAKDQPLSPAQQSAKAEAQRAGLRAQAVREEIDRLQERAADVQERLADTPRVAERLAALERERFQLQGNVQDYADKRLTAAVAANMERRQKGEQFRILESAVAPPDPTFPDRMLIIAMGFVLGIALGAGTGVLKDALDSSFHVSQQLQLAFRIPVLASVPNIFLESDRIAARRRRIRIAIASASITLVVLLGAAGGYVVVNGSPGWLKGAEEETETETPATPEPAAQGGALGYWG